MDYNLPIDQDVDSVMSATTTTSTDPVISVASNDFLDYSTDYPVEDEKPCYFLEDIKNASLEILSKRCQRVISGKVIKLDIQKFYKCIMA